MGKGTQRSDPHIASHITYNNIKFSFVGIIYSMIRGARYDVHFKPFVTQCGSNALAQRRR